MHDYLKRNTLDALILIGDISSRSENSSPPELALDSWHNTLRQRLSLGGKEIDEAVKQLCDEDLIKPCKGTDGNYVRLTEKGTDAYRSYNGIEPQFSFKDEILSFVRKYLPFSRNENEKRN